MDLSSGYERSLLLCIRGAVNIPDEEFWGRVGELPTDRLIILYCYRGPRSMLAARQLARYGYQVADICGGIEAYRGKYLEGYGLRTGR